MMTKAKNLGGSQKVSTGGTTLGLEDTGRERMANTAAGLSSHRDGHQVVPAIQEW
jgi:hypothetical protein